MTFIKFYIILLILNLLYSSTICDTLNTSTNDTNPERVGDYLVTILYGEHNLKYVCSGTVVRVGWILTASECIVKNKNDFQLLENTLFHFYISSPNILDGKLIPIQEIYFHPNFYNFNNSDYNVALLKTETSLCCNNENNTKTVKETDFRTKERAVNLPASIWNYTPENVSLLKEEDIFDKNCCFAVAMESYHNDNNMRVRKIQFDIKVFQASLMKRNTSFDVKVEGDESSLPVGAALMYNGTQYAVKTGQNPIQWTRLQPIVFWIKSKILQHTSVDDTSVSSTIAPDQHGNLSEFRQHRNLEESSKKITETTWFWSYIGSLLGGIVLIFILFLLTIYCGCMRKSRPMRRISRQSDLQKDLYRRRRSIWNQRQSTEIPTPRFCSTPIHGAPNNNDRIPLKRLFMRGIRMSKKDRNSSEIEAS